MYRAGPCCIGKVSHKAVLSSPRLGRISLRIASLSPHSCPYGKGKREISLCGPAQTIQLRPLVITCFAVLLKKAAFIVKLQNRFYCLESSAVVMPQSASFLRPNFIVFISPSCFFILWIFWHVNIFFL